MPELMSRTRLVLRNWHEAEKVVYAYLDVFNSASHYHTIVPMRGFSNDFSVFIDLKYVDSGKPIEIGFRNYKTSTRLYLTITIYLDRRYDITVNGEPIHPNTYRGNGAYTIASFVAPEKLDGSITYFGNINIIEILALYLLERTHNIVTMIINEFERRKRKLLDRLGVDKHKYGYRYISLFKFLKWLRDVVFPLIDQAADLSYVKNIEQLDRLRGVDALMLASLLEFTIKSFDYYYG